jgi:sugar phosphate permease
MKTLTGHSTRGADSMSRHAVLLVTAAIAISYMDRQTLLVAISAIQRSIPLSSRQFSCLQTAFLLSYAALYAIGGRLLDRLGTGRGFLLIMICWSVSCALHCLASGFLSASWPSSSSLAAFNPFVLTTCFKSKPLT